MNARVMVTIGIVMKMAIGFIGVMSAGSMNRRKKHEQLFEKFHVHRYYGADIRSPGLTDIIVLPWLARGISSDPFHCLPV